MHINIQQNRASGSVKTVHTNLFVNDRKLHKFATTNSNFEKIDYLRHASLITYMNINFQQNHVIQNRTHKYISKESQVA